MTAAEALAWQQEARSRLMELVARQEPRRHLDEVPLDLKIEATEVRHGYRLHSISFRGSDGQRRAGLLVVPPGDGPFPAMLAPCMAMVAPPTTFSTLKVPAAEWPTGLPAAVTWCSSLPSLIAVMRPRRSGICFAVSTHSP